MAQKSRSFVGAFLALATATAPAAGFARQANPRHAPREVGMPSFAIQADRHFEQREQAGGQARAIAMAKREVFALHPEFIGNPRQTWIAIPDTSQARHPDYTQALRAKSLVESACRPGKPLTPTVNENLWFDRHHPGRGYQVIWGVCPR